MTSSTTPKPKFGTVAYWRNEAKRREADARVGRVVRSLSEMGRGADEILAHLFDNPMTLAELRAAMIEDRTKAEQDFRQRWEPIPTGNAAEDWLNERLTADSSAVWRDVDYSLLYDVGQLATASIIEVDGEDGVIRIRDFLRESVRVFLRAAFLHHHLTSRPLTNDLRGATRKEA